ncbi:MAG: hypothetical protein JWN64_789 [Parcubacteria group bacterium]|nr:hypothetical protein [Parcubacteria group bacterium]
MTFVTILITLGTAYAPIAEAADSSRLISQAEIAKNMKVLVQEIEQSHAETEDVDLYSFARFTQLENELTASKKGGKDIHKALLALKKLDKKYANNNAYLYITSWIMDDVFLEIPTDGVSVKERDALVGFLDQLSVNHGNTGRMQKVRLMNIILWDHPEFADTFYNHLDAEELLVFNSGMSAGESLTIFPGAEEYEVVGGDILAPVFADPSLEQADEVGRLLASKKGESRFAWAERVASVSRYQYFRGVKPTRKSVRTAELAIEKERSAWQDKKLLKENVLYGATPGEDDRFMDERELARIKELVTDLRVFAAKEGTTYGPREAQAELLKAIEDTEGPITTILHMHGNDEMILFQDAEGSNENEDILWADELANAFAARYAKNPKRTETDVVILESCSAGSFGRLFIEELLAQGIPLPIVFAAGEAGQSTYSKTDGGSEVAEKYLFTGNQTLGDLYDNYTWGLRSNPLLFVPQSSNKKMLLQVS